MKQGIKRTQRDYRVAFKLSVVEQVEKGELTYKDAQRRNGIQGRSTVLVWLRKPAAAGHPQAAPSAVAGRGIKLGRDQLFDVLRAARLLVVPHRAYHKTTHSRHRFRCHPNLLKAGPDQIVPTAPEQVWVADITYLPTAGPFVYLSLVTDAFSRKIVGYHVHDSLQTGQVSQALKMALRRRRTRAPLIHHSDPS